MDTKLKADIAESAVTTELLKRGFNVLKPFGDRLPYDLAVDLDGRLIKIQVKISRIQRALGFIKLVMLSSTTSSHFLLTT
ncbi:MAG: hypothetical protein KKH08_04490 [Candidatus Omnitrophica bacterium]|nr:hypothetical protein [Candidatus Omnitrophota bacterium]